MNVRALGYFGDPPSLCQPHLHQRKRHYTETSTSKIARLSARAVGTPARLKMQIGPRLIMAADFTRCPTGRWEMLPQINPDSFNLLSGIEPSKHPPASQQWLSELESTD